MTGDPDAYDLMRQLFAYDPDNRLTCQEALQHKWFRVAPVPTEKCVDCLCSPYLSELTYLCSAFQNIPLQHIPPQRRITHDDAPSMIPLPTATSQAQTHVQAQLAQVQAQAQAQLAGSHPPSRGSVASFASMSGGAAGAGSGHARKKARMG